MLSTPYSCKKKMDSILASADFAQSRRRAAPSSASSPKISLPLVPEFTAGTKLVPLLYYRDWSLNINALLQPDMDTCLGARGGGLDFFVEGGLCHVFPKIGQRGGLCHVFAHKALQRPPKAPTGPSKAPLSPTKVYVPLRGRRRRPKIWPLRPVY